VCDPSPIVYTNGFEGSDLEVAVGVEEKKVGATKIGGVLQIKSKAL
jgi:hypothetical protein